MSTTIRPKIRTRPLLEVRELRKYYPVQSNAFGNRQGQIRAVDGVSFEIQDGETLGLVGESGCGKTTLARCLLRAIEPTSGEILFRTGEGDVVDLASLRQRELRPIRREIQLIFQNPFTSLNPRMNLLDIVGEPLLVNGMTDRDQRVEQVTELLRLVGMGSEDLLRFPHAFSGAQRQRIGIARALALKPRLVVADEPVSALDVSIQAQVLNLMLELQQKFRLTYLFVSHDLTVIRYICDRVAVMYLGRIVEMGTTEDVFRSPQHPYTAALLSAVLDPDPSLRGELNVLPGEVPSPTNPPQGCHFNPRCPHAADECLSESPELEETPAGGWAACHRSRELSLDGID